MEQSLWNSPIFFPEDVFEAEKKIDLLQRDSDNYFPNA